MLKHRGLNIKKEQAKNQNQEAFKFLSLQLSPNK